MPTPSDDKLSSLLNASLLLNSTLSMRDVLHTLSLFATRHTGADRTTLYLLSEDARQLVSEIAQGDEIREVRVDVGSGIAGAVAASGEILNVPNAYDDERFDPSKDKKSGYRTRNLLAVPIKDRRGKILGVLQVLNKNGGDGFDASDSAYLTNLATHAAVAIQNARVYERLSQERNELQAENLRLQRRTPGKPGDPVGSSPAFREALETARAVADSTANVLLRGESGSGKGVFAKYIHQLSRRAKGPLVQINCSAIPHDLLESELFGIERGVATGVEARKGRLEMANKGTCFLDEIGDMSSESQAKILKVIEDRELERVGGRNTMPLDVRLIAATHQDLEQLIETKEFRADLYYRLNVVTLWLPSLRERGEDVAELAEFFVSRFAKRNDRGEMRMAPETVELLRAYEWPGNVRELENALERAVVLTRGDVIDVGALPPELRGEGRTPSAPPSRTHAARSAGSESGGASELMSLNLRESLDQYEKALILRALKATQGTQTAAARALGISESNLRYKMKKHGVDH